MPKHRSMAAALSPEMLGFIRDGNSGVKPQERLIAAETAMLAPPASDNTSRAANRMSKSTVAPLPSAPMSHQTQIPELLVPLTTRLRASTAEALRRAYLEQRLHRRAPATQQEIVEAALAAWLAANGYLA